MNASSRSGTVPPMVGDLGPEAKPIPFASTISFDHYCRKLLRSFTRSKAPLTRVPSLPPSRFRALNAHEFFAARL